jgi:hypothetical protein
MTSILVLLLACARAALPPTADPVDAGPAPQIGFEVRAFEVGSFGTFALCPSDESELVLLAIENRGRTPWSYPAAIVSFFPFTREAFPGEEDPCERIMLASRPGVVFRTLAPGEGAEVLVSVPRDGRARRFGLGSPVAWSPPLVSGKLRPRTTGVPFRYEPRARGGSPPAAGSCAGCQRDRPGAVEPGLPPMWQAAAGRTSPVWRHN